ncbi:MAG: hypothetical protein MJ211_09650 [Bacteroidales bacterium]|nr:hypothetical protein [Bacteroidales bacterium]
MTQINRKIVPFNAPIMKLHDDFIEDVRHQIDNIAELKRKGDIKGAALAGLELAKSKVAYYEQFINLDAPHTGTNKIYLDDYNTALRQLGVARDKCLDLGIWES